MNILLINYEFPPIGGGAGNATMFIARALANDGHKAVVLTAAFAGDAGLRVEEGVWVSRISCRRRRMDRASAVEMLSFVATAWRAALAVSRQHRIEAVIVFFSLPCGPVALRLHRLEGLPYIVSLRGGDVPGLVPEICWQHRLLKPLRRRVLRSARAIVANDPGLARLSEAADPWPVHVISNGVDCKFFRPPAGDAAESPDFAGPIRLLFAGRLHRQKNLRLLIEQFSILLSENPGHWHLTILGDGAERGELAAYARSVKADAAIEWKGWQAKESLLGHYQAATALVNPSFYEGLPNVVLEGMACGLPIVASNIPGNNTLVADGVTGVLFELGDPGSLKAALSRIGRNRHEAAQMGRNGRERALAEYSWSRVAQRYLDLFSKPPPTFTSP